MLYLTDSFNTLHKNAWLDWRTAAVFVEFPLYNANANLYAYCAILFEATSSGNLVASAEFRSLDPSEMSVQDLFSFKILMALLYLACICVLMLKELTKLVAEGCNYFLLVYNYIDLLLIVFSWSAFATFLYRMYAFNGLSKLIRQSSNGSK